MKRIFGEYGGFVLAAIAAALVLKSFVIGAIRVPSESMESTLLPGDCVLINKLAYGAGWFPALRSVQRGDVIVFRFPDDRADPVCFVKRCIALGGDMIEIRKGRCLVNDEPVPYRSSGNSMEGEQFGPIKVPSRGDFVSLTAAASAEWEPLIRREGHQVGHDRSGAILIDGLPETKYRVERNYLFVLGDNTNKSYDSREWGFLPDEDVVGSAMMIYWSLPDRPTSDNLIARVASMRWDRLGMIVR